MGKGTIWGAYETSDGQGIEQGIGRGRQLEKENLIKLISSMNAGGDTDKVAQLDDPEVLLAMQRKYGMINLWHL